MLRAPSARSVTVQTSALVKGSDAVPAPTMHRVDYVTISTAGDHYDRLGAWPDPLWPLDSGGSLSLPAGQNQPLWLTVQVGRIPVALTPGWASVVEWLTG